MKNTIESLTEEQKAMLPVYRDRWLKIGLATGKADRPKAEAALNRAYQVAGLEPPKQIIWAQSPLSGWLTVCCLRDDNLMKKIYADVGKYVKSGAAKPPLKLGASVWDSVGASVWDSVGDSVWASVWDSVGDSVWASVGASVWASVGASVRDSVGDSVRASVGDSVRDSVKNFSYSETCFGSHDANWLGFYQYFLEVLKLEACEKLLPLMDLSKEGGWFYPYRNICVISERPVEIHMDGTRLHKEGGAAIRYADGFSVYALNGVRVPDWLAETPKEKLDADKVLALPNAEQRAQGIKKVGIGVLFSRLNTQVIDTWRDYELVTIEFEKRRIGPYLRMINRTTGETHVEGVGTPNGGIDEKIKTCQDALAWRNGLTKFVEPKVLT